MKKTVSPLVQLKSNTMSKPSFYIKWILFFATIFITSCKNDADEKKVIIKDSIVYVHDTTNIQRTVKIHDTTKIHDTARTHVTTRIYDTTRVHVNMKTSENQKDRAKEVSEAAKTTDVKPTENPAPVTVTPVTTNTGTEVVDNTSKYGVIPRNATETNMALFFKAFTDKNTSIRINFDGTADAEMNKVKAQIIKVLRTAGYTNVADQSTSIDPIRMPREIHYELQHDKSVIFWVPVAGE